MTLCFTLSSLAETYFFKAYEFAAASVSSSGYYTWGNWKKCKINIYIDDINCTVKINSAAPQNYKILKVIDSYYDDEGGKNYRYCVIDQDEDLGEMRLRTVKDDTQIYFDFSDVAWVYNVTLQ